jgi:hypothetical protein
MRKRLRNILGIILVLILAGMIILIVVQSREGSQRIEDISDEIDATQRADE